MKQEEHSKKYFEPRSLYVHLSETSKYNPNFKRTIYLKVVFYPFAG